MEYKLTAPMTREQARQLRCGDTVLFTGTIYTARDAAHKRLVELLDQGKPLPFDVDGAVIYYAGPTPAQKGHAVGSCGPTTSYRMDAYAPKVIAAGSTGMIGKGKWRGVLCRHWRSRRPLGPVREEGGSGGL